MNFFSTKPPQQSPDVKSSNVFIKDISAAAMLSDCREKAQQLLLARYTAETPYQQHHAMESLFQCMNHFMMDPEIGAWRTGEKDGNIYWFKIMSRWSNPQWERPENLQKIISEGKRNTNYTEKWQECEFLHISLFTCEQQFQERAEFKCIHHHQRLNQCMQERLNIDSF